MTAVATAARPTSCSTPRWPPPSRIPEQASRLQRGLLQTGAHDELAPAVREAARARRRHARRGGDLRRDGREPPRAGQARGGLRRAAARRRIRARERCPARAARRDGARVRADWSSWSSGCWRSSSVAAARPTWASPARCCCWRRTSPSATSAIRCARSICTAAPRRCSPVRSTSSRGSRASRSSRRNVAECDRVTGVFKLTAAEARTPEAAAEALYRAAGLELGRARDARRRHRRAVRGDREEPRSGARVGAGRRRGRARRRAGQDPAALRAHRAPVRRRRRAARLPRAAGGDVRRHAPRGPRGRRSGRRASPRRSPRAAAGAAGWTSRPTAPTGARTRPGRCSSCSGSRRAPASSTRAAQILERAAELLPLERVRAAGPRSRRAGRPLRQPAPRRRAARTPARHARRPTNPSGGRCWTTTSACATATASRAWWRRRCRCCRRSRSEISCAWRSRGCSWPTTPATAPPPRSCRTSCWRSRATTEALALLAGYYERSGSEGDLVDLLAQAFDAAIAARDPEAVVAAAIRLGGVLERKDAERAAETYERALTVAPRRGELLKRVLALRPGRHGHARARRADGGGPRRRDRRRGRAPRARAGGRCGRRSATWRPCGACWRRATRKRRPRRARARRLGRSEFFADLTPLSRQAGLGALANLYASEAERRSDATEAAALLRRSRVAAPGPPGRRARAASSCCAAPARAPRRTSRSWSSWRARWSRTASWARPSRRSARRSTTRAWRPEQRLPLHLLRAKLEGAPGRSPRGGERAGGGVRAVAARPRRPRWWPSWRRGARTPPLRTPPPSCREATLRLAELARGAGDAAQARRLLDELVARGAADADTVRLTWELAEAEGDTRERVLRRAAVPAASPRAKRRSRRPRQLVALAERIGKAPDAAAAIEAALAAHPDQLALIDLLAPLYEQTGQLAQAGRAAPGSGEPQPGRRAALRAAPPRRRVRGAGAGRVAGRHGAERGAGRPPHRRGDDAAAVGRLRAGRRARGSRRAD